MNKVWASFTLFCVLVFVGLVVTIAGTPVGQLATPVSSLGVGLIMLALPFMFAAIIFQMRGPPSTEPPVRIGGLDYWQDWRNEQHDNVADRGG